MYARVGSLILISLLLMVGITSAAVSVLTTTLPTSANGTWLEAGNPAQARISVHVTNATSGALIPGASVEFKVLNSALGSMNPVMTLTDTNADASSNFSVTTKSGTAVIQINVTAPEGLASVPVTINIDHAKAYYAYFNYNPEITVNTTTQFNISLTDKYGNPIDNRNVPPGAHTVHLHFSSPDGNGGIWNGVSYIKDDIFTLNANGNLSVDVLVGKTPGENILWMEQVDYINDQYLFIEAISNAIPFSITQIVAPWPPSLPADGVSEFSIKYTLYDVFDNPTKNRSIWVNTTIPGEEIFLTSNSLGEVWVQYGPKWVTGYVDIRAVSVDNSSVRINQTVEFYNTAATNMVVTANPESMASLDANNASYSTISANVMDIKGNAAPGELVTFAITPATYDAVYNVTAAPTLVSNWSITDVNGMATVTFKPGAFTANKADLNYNATATGHCNVIATWNGTSKTIAVTWKNYPYLSVKTFVNPKTVQVNGTVDVTVNLSADGWALQPDPIDVVMCTDRSGSMLQNQTDNIIHDRFVHAMNAGKIFNVQMSANDRVGLVSFGDNSATNGWAKLSGTSTNRYGSYQWAGVDTLTSDNAAYVGLYYPASPRNYGTTQFASIDQNLSFVRTTVNTSINTMVPAGGTPMREGLYRSVKMLIDYPRPKAVSAVVLLTDGAWNTGGNPQGGAGVTSFPTVGTGSVITWAKNNKIKIFTIALGTDPSQTELRAYANETGGKFYAAPTADQLAGVYTSIAGELKTTAGVNTTMGLAFNNINLTGISVPGAEVYDYVNLSPVSTSITWQDNVTNWTDQSSEWATAQNLSFDIGTMTLGQKWSTTFRLKIKKAGSIDVFGSGSTISFNGGAATLDIPHTYITAVDNLTNTGWNYYTLDVKDLQCTKSGVINDFLPVMWSLSYNGTQAVTQIVQYSNVQPVHWIKFATKFDYAGNSTQYANLDVKTLPPGNYTLRVDATANDAPADWDINWTPIIVGTQGRAFIKIE